MTQIICDICSKPAGIEPNKLQIYRTNATASLTGISDSIFLDMCQDCKKAIVDVITTIKDAKTK